MTIHTPVSFSCQQYRFVEKRQVAKIVFDSVPFLSKNGVQWQENTAGAVLSPVAWAQLYQKEYVATHLLTDIYRHTD